MCRGIEFRTQVSNTAMVANLERGGLKPNSFMYRTDVDALRREEWRPLE
jgi:metal-dependent amidase/aminoacylase/carboxypeptidase family protein